MGRSCLAVGWGTARGRTERVVAVGAVAPNVGDPPPPSKDRLSGVAAPPPPRFRKLPPAHGPLCGPGGLAA